MKYYLRCHKCGHYNPVDSEYLVYCEKCKTHLLNNYIDWVNLHPNNNFEDFKKFICVSSETLPKANKVDVELSERVVSSNISKTKKKKRKLTKGQLAGIIIGAVAAAVFGQIGKKVASDFIENRQLNKIERIEFAAADSTDWILFKNKEANFEMFFPGKTIEDVQLVETEIGRLEVKQFLFEPDLGKDANILYGVGFTTYPSEFVDNTNMDNDQLDEFFTNSINGTINNVQGKLLSATIIDYKGYPGREIKIDFRDGLAIIKMRTYLVNNRLYIMQVIIPTKNNFNKSINYFLNSFKLLEKA